MADLATKKVLFAGLGRFSSEPLLKLVRLGLASQGSLYLIDGDRVEERNLEGTLYLPRHVGRFKTEAMMDLIQEINPKTAENTRIASKMITLPDVEKISSSARELDLVVIGLDDHEIADSLADTLYPLCPILSGYFGEHCNNFMVGYSIAQVMPPLSLTLSRQKMETIHAAVASADDLMAAQSFIFKLILRLLSRGDPKAEAILHLDPQLPLFYGCNRNDPFLLDSKDFPRECQYIVVPLGWRPR